MIVPTLATPGLTFNPADHVYRLDGVTIPSVTQVLKDNRLSADFSRVDPVTLERARALGAAVHTATHYLDEGDLDLASVDPEVAPYLDAWETFKTTRGVTIHALEQQYASPAYRFAGTIDRLITVRDGRLLVLVDLKTGDFEGAEFQTAAYQILLNQPVDRWVVHLHPGSGLGYTVHPYRRPSDRAVFLAALSLTHTRAAAGRSWEVA